VEVTKELSQVNAESIEQLTTSKYNTVKDILDFIDGWRTDKKDISPTGKLSDEQIAQFVKDLHGEIEKMDFTVPKGTIILGYSGIHGIKADGKPVCAWEIADGVSKKLGDEATYISDLPAGMLIGKERKHLVEALENIVGDNEDYINQIISGTDADWNRLENAGTCGFGDNLPALDDLISSKLMGESKNVSSNLIVFIPQAIEEQNNFHKKVFPVTEIGQIFKNDAFQTINGIPKEQLQSIYSEPNGGKECVYDILSQMGREVVGNEMTLQGQTDLLAEAVSENGLLTPERSNYTINKCYDIYNNFIGVELRSKNQEQPLIKAPEGTIRRESYGQSQDNMNMLFDTPKLSLYIDASGVLREGIEPPKPTIIRSLNGELKMTDGFTKGAAEQISKGAIKDFVR